jgi:hypothetical protein
MLRQKPSKVFDRWVQRLPFAEVPAVILVISLTESDKLARDFVYMIFLLRLKSPKLKASC